jgi:hypothetical protein
MSLSSALRTRVLFVFNDVGDSFSLCVVQFGSKLYNNTVICGRATAAAEVDHLRNRIVSCHYGLPAMVPHTIRVVVVRVVVHTF